MPSASWTARRAWPLSAVGLITSTQCSPDTRASNRSQQRARARRGRAEVVDRDLEDLVVDGEQVVDHLEPRVVRARPGRGTRRRSARRRRSACRTGRCRGRGGSPPRTVSTASRAVRQVEAVRADLLVVLHHVGAVLRDVDQLVAAELAAQGRVLPTARRAQQDPAAVELVEQRPEVVVDPLLVVEQRAVHVDGDEADVGDGVEDEEVPRDDPLSRPRGPGARRSRPAPSARSRRRPG